jgi:two-component system OmpR family response regulator
MNGAPHILIVDDHREIRDLVARVLTREGFRVSMAGEGRAMRKVLADSRIDLVLLDLMLPGEDGLSLCRTIRAESTVPIIMLTAKGEEVDRVIGLEMGADDYLPKPFGSRELVARIRAVLRRGRTEDARIEAAPLPKRYRFDRWILETESRELLRDDGLTVPLSTITLFDGPVITEIDVLPASASRLLYGGREADAGSDGSAAPLSRSIEFVVYDALAQQIGGRKLTD